MGLRTNDDVVLIEPADVPRDSIQLISDRKWTRSEKPVWIAAMSVGTCMLYASRTVMPLCIVAISKEMEWTKSDSATILSSFFWGYTLSQVLGGYLSDRIGGETVLAVGATGWGILTLLTPKIAYLYDDKLSRLYTLVFFRVIIGAFQGLHMPSLTSLISRKVAEGEKSFAYSIATSGSHLGTLFCGSVGSIFLEKFGWEAPFYVVGVLTCCWVLLLRLHLLPKQREVSRLILIKEIGQFTDVPDAVHANRNPKDGVPWMLLIKTPAFWSLLIGHFCQNNAFFILLSWLPTYFHENFPHAKGWIFNVVPWLVTFPSALLSGWLADYMMAKGLSATAVRKIIESVALFGAAFFLFVISYSQSFAGALFCMAMALCSCGFHHGGVMMNPQDIAPRFAGSVFGVMNMAGSVPGFVGVYLTGYILETTKSWSVVFNLTSAVCIFGITVYLIFGTARRLI